MAIWSISPSALAQERLYMSVARPEEVFSAPYSAGGKQGGEDSHRAMSGIHTNTIGQRYFKRRLYAHIMH